MTDNEPTSDGESSRHFLFGTWRQEPAQRGMTIDGAIHINEDEAGRLIAACGRCDALARRLNFSAAGS
jgi:hypothetical protein